MQPTYMDMVERTLREGTEIPSRYGSTFERRNCTVAVMAGEFPVRPRLNYRIGLMEGLFLVGGFFDLDRIVAVAPRADHSLFTANGAYGPRIRDQIYEVVRVMEKVPEARQHILYIGRPGDQYTVDAPCTNSIQFLIRDNFLNTVVNMRSSDIIKGLPTDLIQFGLLTQVLALCLGVGAGVVAVNAASSHLYRADLDRVPLPDDPVKDRGFSVPLLPGLEALGAPERFLAYQGWARGEAERAPWVDYSPVRMHQ